MGSGSSVLGTPWIFSSILQAWYCQGSEKQGTIPHHFSCGLLVRRVHERTAEPAGDRRSTPVRPAFSTNVHGPLILAVIDPVSGTDQIKDHNEVLSYYKTIQRFGETLITRLRVSDGSSPNWRL